MTDSKTYLPHHREQYDNRLIDGISAALSASLLVVMIGMIVFSCADAFDKTAENQAKYYGKPVESTYRKPAAYRLQSPTQSEMDHLHGLMVIQEVQR